MQTVAIEGVIRQEVGTKHAKAARREENVPCVIYGGEEIIHFTADVTAFKHLIYTPDFKVAEIKIGDNSMRAILKDAQFHPVSDKLLHVDFLQLVEGRNVKAQVPVNITGVAPGVKQGGKLQQQLRKVTIMATPEVLVDHVTVDISGLDLGQSVRVRDIKPVEGVTVLNEPATPVAAIEIPRALRSAMMEAAKADAKAAKKKK